jgi:hypothetical protein
MWPFSRQPHEPPRTDPDLMRAREEIEATKRALRQALSEEMDARRRDHAERHDALFLGILPGDRE